MKQTNALGLTFNFDELGTVNDDGVQVASTGQEITALKLATTESGSALVYLYDSRNPGGANPSTLRWILDSSSGNPDRDTFANPLSFKHGIYARLVQGANLGAILCVGIVKYGIN